MRRERLFAGHCCGLATGNATKALTRAAAAAAAAASSALARYASSATKQLYVIVHCSSRSCDVPQILGHFYSCTSVEQLLHCTPKIDNSNPLTYKKTAGCLTQAYMYQQHS